MNTLFDYPTLRVIWWLLIGVLLIGFAIMDGFDLGIGATFRILGRTDAERRALLGAVEPVWEGNQVWFILGGGATFAAWPVARVVGGIGLMTWLVYSTIWGWLTAGCAALILGLRTRHTREEL